MFTTHLSSSDAPWLGTVSEAIIISVVPSIVFLQTTVLEPDMKAPTATGVVLMYANGASSTTVPLSTGLTQPYTTIWEYLKDGQGSVFSTLGFVEVSVPPVQTTVTVGSSQPLSSVILSVNASSEAFEIPSATEATSLVWTYQYNAQQQATNTVAFMLVDTALATSAVQAPPSAQITIPGSASSVTLTDSVTEAFTVSVPTGTTGLVSVLTTDKFTHPETLVYEITGAGPVQDNVDAGGGGVIQVIHGQTISVGGVAFTTITEALAGTASRSTFVAEKAFLLVSSSN